MTVHDLDRYRVKTVRWKMECVDCGTQYVTRKVSVCPVCGSRELINHGEDGELSVRRSTQVAVC